MINNYTSTVALHARNKHTAEVLQLASIFCKTQKKTMSMLYIFSSTRTLINNNNDGIFIDNKKKKMSTQLDRWLNLNIIVNNIGENKI